MPSPASLDEVETQELVEEVERRLKPVEAAAMFLDTHVSYVWRLVSEGRLRTVKLFGRSLFEISELEQEHQRRTARKRTIELNRASQITTEPVIPFDKWTVRELQRECKYRGLRVRGNKAQLIARLVMDE